jgi:hypothetical protein
MGESKPGAKAATLRQRGFLLQHRRSSDETERCATTL